RYAQNEFAEAAADFAALADRSTDPQQRARATLGQAWSLFQAGDTARAAPLFESLLEKPAQRIEAEYGVALTANAAGDLDGARWRLESLVPEADGEDHRLAAAVHLQLGDCLLAQGQPAAADEQFIAGLESAPRGRWAADLWLGRMRASHAANDHET